MKTFRSKRLFIVLAGLCFAGQAQAQSDASPQLKEAEQRFGQHMQEGVTAIEDAGAAMDVDDRTSACKAMFRARNAYGDALDTLDEIIGMLRAGGDTDELNAARELHDNLESSVAQIGDTVDDSCTPQSTAL